MSGMEHLEINGAQVFVDDRGPADGVPLLYIHGGPGQGCWDFMASVADRLVDEGIRVIGVDQRGVLRSDPLPEGAPVNVPLLIDDFESVRTQLNISSWFVLGHSAGGGYALDYATAHPDSIRGAIFDCPCWDCDATDRYRLPVAADLLAEAGKHEAAATCRSGHVPRPDTRADSAPVPQLALPWRRRPRHTAVGDREVSKGHARATKHDRPSRALRVRRATRRIRPGRGVLHHAGLMAAVSRWRSARNRPFGAIAPPGSTNTRW